MARLQWYARRLRSMGAREIAWRFVRVADERLGRDPGKAVPEWSDEQWQASLDRFRAATERPVLLDRDRAARIAAQNPAAVQELVAAADLVAARKFGFFAYPRVELAEPIDWNHDPIADVRWPAIPAAKIDHRTAAGDAKWIWELNRLQHLPWLAQAWLFTGDDRYSKAAFAQLDSWLEQNPPGVGIAWRGAFEAGIRAISVTVAMQGLRDSPDLTVDRYRRLVSVLAISARRCWIERSRFSSANNHLVGELTGLAVVAMFFPDLPAAANWEKSAIAGLVREADLQILADGAAAEQAVGYQVFTADFLLLISALLRSRNDFRPEFLDAVERSATYLGALVGPDDPDPRYGDEDEGFALRLGTEPRRTIRQHLGAVASFGGNVAAGRFGVPTLSAAWLAEIDVPERLRRSSIPAGELILSGDPADGRTSAYAPVGGLVVLRRGSVRTLMDVAPLGYLSIAAHGHADALAVGISVGEQDIVGDPGTGSYYGNPAWRDVHRGTRAHATVEVDGTNQSTIGGPFLWTMHARTHVRSVDLANGVVDAEHYGYEQLAEPVVHRRWLIAHPDARSIVVVDRLSGAGTHDVRTSWPIHPALDVAVSDTDCLVTKDGRSVLHIAATATTSLQGQHVRGDEATNLGWWSTRLESRSPAWLLGWYCAAELPLVLATVLTPFENAEFVENVGVENVKVAYSDGVVDLTWTDSGAPCILTIDTRLDAHVQMHTDRISTQTTELQSND